MAQSYESVISCTATAPESFTSFTFTRLILASESYVK